MTYNTIIVYWSDPMLLLCTYYVILGYSAFSISHFGAVLPLGHLI